MSPDSSTLSARLARQIETSGPISVAEYMRAANEAYYANRDPFGREGDFITAPEISQMFGELISLWMTDIWMRNFRPEGCNYVELGPGRGTLAADILRNMALFDFRPQVNLVETSEYLTALQKAAVPEARHFQSIVDLPETGPLFVVANEFFDALPVQQIEATHAGWRERVVVRDRGDRFLPMAGLKAMDAAIPPALRNAPSPSIFECSPDASELLFEIAVRLAKQGGVMLIIDYGYAASGLGSTLQAVKDHAPVDPFENPGEYDLSAHVNFSALANIAKMRGLRASGPVAQGLWLRALGIDHRARALAENAPERSDEINAARDRLVEADQMGQLFKILAISSEDWPIPEGFDLELLPEDS